jgi:hypothetical protein
MAPRRSSVALATCALAVAVAVAVAVTVASAAERVPTHPSAVHSDDPAIRHVYFGDLHLHTSLSLDAYIYDPRTTLEDAYRYAKGERVRYLGREVQRRAPLDFLAVTDHSEFLGVLPLVARQDGPYAGSSWEKLVNSPDPKVRQSLFWKLNTERPAEFRGTALIRSQWQQVIAAAQAHYHPGKFTTFVAYEWSSTPQRQNLHRNVIFRGPKFPQQPFSSLDSEHPEDLWTYLERQRALGVESLAIPHNSNLSNGLMFENADSYGRPISRAYAERRARHEHEVEITQTKGTSETTPELSPTDEFADFELYRYLLGSDTAGKLDGSYVRQGLGRGLEIEQRVGVNPFKLGWVGGSDFHTGLSAAEEANFPGGHGRLDDAQHPETALSAKLAAVGKPVLFSASGLTGVWAEHNTRESIFGALERRETFATSGDRIAVRLFGGWDFPGDIVHRGDWVAQAYGHGVPMGGDLPPPPGEAGAHGSAGPHLLIWALKDPDRGNLDRIQIVKIWVQDGVSHERMVDAAWSGSRRPDPRTGAVPPVGNTVNLREATFTNDIGAAELQGEWTDPDFNPRVPAVYYARVLSIPTPRWSTYLAVRNHLPLPTDVPATIQERAWTSPVFYTPPGR